MTADRILQAYNQIHIFIGAQSVRRELGNTGVHVNPIGLGTWQLACPGRPPAGEAIRVIRGAIDAGVELIDTADCYAIDDSEFGYAERLVKTALDGVDTNHVRVTTKAGFRRPGGDWLADGNPRVLEQRCNESLARLGVEQIFLYQLHGVDPRVPLEDAVGALAELRRAGKVAHIGLSNVTPNQLAIAETVTRIESVQNACNAWAQRDVTNGLIEQCSQHSVAYLPFYPVGGAGLHKSLATDSLLVSLAEKYATSSYCILLNWLLRLGPHIVPIPGASRTASILDSVTAVKFELDESDFSAIGALARTEFTDNWPGLQT